MKISGFILTIIFLVTCFGNLQSQNTPRVFVFTDINIDSGDPDDRQSLIHLHKVLKPVNWLLKPIQKITLHTILK